MHTIEKGDISVAMVTARLLQCGYVVLRPVSELSRYDLAVDKAGRFDRIQVKTGRLRKGTIRFKTCSSTTHRYGGKMKEYHGEIEAFGVYCPDNDKVYLVPVEQVGKREAWLRIDEPKNGMTKSIRLAIDYEIK